MLVTIIIPVFNAGDYLRQCLDSILVQTYTEIEIIMIDDGSTDQSGDLCDFYQSVDNRVMAIHQQNAGVSAARNQGVAAGHGEYYTFVGADDILRPEYIEEMISLAESERGDLVISGISFVYPNKVVSSRSSGSMRRIEQIDLVNGFFTDSDLKLVLYGPYNKLFRYSIFSNVRFDHNIKLGEDLLYVFECLLKCDSAIYLEKPLYSYFKRDSSVTGEAFNTKKKDYVIASGKIKNLCIQYSIAEPNAEIWYYICVLNYYRQLCGYPEVKAQQEEFSEACATYLREKKSTVWKFLPTKSKMNYVLIRTFPFVIRIAVKLGKEV